jgi:hypothetical protein
VGVANKSLGKEATLVEETKPCKAWDEGYAERAGGNFIVASDWIWEAGKGQDLVWHHWDGLWVPTRVIDYGRDLEMVLFRW